MTEKDGDLDRMAIACDSAAAVTTAMCKVVGSVHRDMVEGLSAEDKPHSRWRAWLMNWSHDPLKG